MSLHEDLRRQARHLATREPRKPSQASLRRAVSAGYYALFHLLIDEATGMMFGHRPAARPLRYTIGRAFSHQSMVAACKGFRAGSVPPQVAAALGARAIPADLQDVATAFVELQEARHRADYDLARPFTRGEVTRLLGQMDRSFLAWRRVRRDEAARLFLMALPLWDRLRR